jgi:hypothetical protein
LAPSPASASLSKSCTPAAPEDEIPRQNSAGGIEERVSCFRELALERLVECGGGFAAGARGADKLRAFGRVTRQLKFLRDGICAEHLPQRFRGAGVERRLGGAEELFGPGDRLRKLLPPAEKNTRCSHRAACLEPLHYIERHTRERMRKSGATA